MHAEAITLLLFNSLEMAGYWKGEGVRGMVRKGREEGVNLKGGEGRRRVEKERRGG